jgi:hypothetical protein
MMWMLVSRRAGHDAWIRADGPPGKFARIVDGRLGAASVEQPMQSM